MTQTFHGLFRATVVDTVDPMQIGGLQVLARDVTGVAPSSRADPCFPTGGMQVGMCSVPMIGAGVCVSFEQGDPDCPVWLGVFYGLAAEKPLLANTAPPPTLAITLQMPLKNGILIADAPTRRRAGADGGGADGGGGG
jgi:hypothetical protein